MMSSPRVIIATLTAVLCACLVAAIDAAPADRDHIIRKAHVWTPIETERLDLRRGPDGAGGFAPGESITCEFVNKDLEGNSPKFVCRISANDEVKVKFGGTNGEVYGEVIATRLLWALGFAADRMYPVSVICRGCPSEFAGIARPGGESRFAPAVIERKTGSELKSDSAWSWKELDLAGPEHGGAPRAHRDALKLLAVFMQHTDSKPQQQRIVCLDETDACERPVLMLNDVGLTFGQANAMNGNARGSVNLERWRATPVWKEGQGCVGNLSKSLTGTLEHPTISEEGRAFLADLLGRLTDKQLFDLFDVAGVTVRVRDPEHARSGFPTVAEWVTAFKEKRDQIASRRCA